MIALMQLLKILDEQQRELLKEYLLDLDEGITAQDAVDNLEMFLWDQCQIDLSLRDREKESLVRIIENGSAASAFSLAGVA